MPDKLTLVQLTLLMDDRTCPFCKDTISEIQLEHQFFTHRVLCLGCKRCGDDFSFGRAYISFPTHKPF